MGSFLAIESKSLGTYHIRTVHSACILDIAVEIPGQKKKDGQEACPIGG